MLTESVTEVWEFYRDSHDGFKEPMRKRLRKLDRHVAGLEDENAQLRTQLADVTESMGRVEERCAGLREACAELLEMAESLDPDWLHWPEMYEELRGLGVEV